MQNYEDEEITGTVGGRVRPILLSVSAREGERGEPGFGTRLGLLLLKDTSGGDGRTWEEITTVVCSSALQ